MGVCADYQSNQLYATISSMKVFIIAALTVDGFVARDADQFSMEWTSKEDIKRFVSLTKEAGVMVMGSRTFATTIKAGRRLPGRKMVVYTSRPGGIEHSRTDPTEFTSESPVDLISRLKNEGYASVAVCGGSQIYSLFMEAGVVTDLYLTLEPKLFGKGLSLLGNQVDINLTLHSFEKLGENALALHYKVSV
jgi:dihydrofolate reductase